MNRDLAVLIAALIVNFLAAITLNLVTSPALSWLLFSVVSTATAMVIYGGWRVVQETRVLGAIRATFVTWIVYARERALRLTKPKATGGASASETGFRCSISDTSGLLVTYVGPDSCELSRLLAAIREFRLVPARADHPVEPTGP